MLVEKEFTCSTSSETETRKESRKKELREEVIRRERLGQNSTVVYVDGYDINEKRQGSQKEVGARNRKAYDSKGRTQVNRGVTSERL